MKKCFVFLLSAFLIAGNLVAQSSAKPANNDDLVTAKAHYFKTELLSQNFGSAKPAAVIYTYDAKKTEVGQLNFYSEPKSFLKNGSITTDKKITMDFPMEMYSSVQELIEASKSALELQYDARTSTASLVTQPAVFGQSSGTNASKTAIRNPDLQSMPNKLNVNTKKEAAIKK